MTQNTFPFGQRLADCADMTPAAREMFYGTRDESICASDYDSDLPRNEWAEEDGYTYTYTLVLEEEERWEAEQAYLGDDNEAKDSTDEFLRGLTDRQRSELAQKLFNMYPRMHWLTQHIMEEEEMAAADQHELDVYDSVIDDMYDDYLRTLEDEQRQRFADELNSTQESWGWGSPLTDDEIEDEYLIWVNNIRWQQDMKGGEPDDCPTCGQRAADDNLGECLACFFMGMDYETEMPF